MKTSSPENIYLDKTATIGIVGMGYVGMPLALAAGSSRLSVVGFDIDTDEGHRHQRRPKLHQAHADHGRSRRP